MQIYFILNNVSVSLLNLFYTKPPKDKTVLFNKTNMLKINNNLIYYVILMLYKATNLHFFAC